LWGPRDWHTVRSISPSTRETVIWALYSWLETVRYCRVPSPSVGKVLLALIKSMKNVNRHSFIQKLCSTCLDWTRSCSSSNLVLQKHTHCISMEVVKYSAPLVNSHKSDIQNYWICSMLFANTFKLFCFLIFWLWDIPERRRAH
jgi:tRNA isopentenyl-2-thiomethyl-A-37 hydroxylase MiaE